MTRLQDARTYLALLCLTYRAHLAVRRLERRADRGLDIREDTDRLEARIADGQRRVQAAIRRHESEPI